MKVWLHRISYKGHLSVPLLEKENLLTIGWSDMALPEMKDCIAKKNAQDFNARYLAIYGYLPRSRWSVFSFVGGMSVGDRVIVPRSGAFRVYEIISDAEFCAPDLAKEDLGWQRKAKPLTEWLSRSKYADAPLATRMKWRGTTLEISDLSESINRAIENKPLSIFSDIVEATLPTWSSLIAKNSTPDKFERLLAWYFKRAGANEVLIPPKNESGKVGDCDVEAVFEALRMIISVQVKFHDGATSGYSVDQISDYADDADTSEDDLDYIRAKWVVSTANTFTEDAKIKAKEKNVLLLNKEDFVFLLLSVGIDDGIDV